jgi:hypothetical protein|tara:strand:+ start:9 stop:248 length:240 start_codon:yes stop_codon:yes gene_type:complete
MSDQAQLIFIKDDVKYDVNKLSPEGQSVFGILLNAQNKMRNAELEVTLARASIMTLNQSMSEHLVDEAIIEDEQAETED